MHTKTVEAIKLLKPLNMYIKHVSENRCHQDPRANFSAVF